MLGLLAAAGATALATGLGVIPVQLMGHHARELQPALLGVAAGVMSVAALDGLLRPALDEGPLLPVAIGAAVGVAGLLAGRRLLAARRGREGGSDARATALLVFAVLLIHSFPEGFAIGTAWASTEEGLALFVVLAIGIQNIPEGTSVAIPMLATGASFARQFWAAVATSAPQPVGAAIAYLLLEWIEALLPFSLGLAAGAMLALVAVELLPGALRARPGAAVAGIVAGALGMWALSAAISV